MAGRPEICPFCLWRTPWYGWCGLYHQYPERIWTIRRKYKIDRWKRIIVLSPSPGPFLHNAFQSNEQGDQKKDVKKDLKTITSKTPADEPRSEDAPENTLAPDFKDDGKVQESEDISKESTQEEA